MIDSYARLSWNPDTLELEKIKTQFADNRETIIRHGGVVGLELSDGLSAWKRNVRRPDFETLMERAFSGVTQGIAIWHTDRLFRQPRDLERLIDLAKSGFLIISSHGTRNLSDPDDRYAMRGEVNAAAKASDDTSRRVLRRIEIYRKQGRRVAGRPGFGFTRKDETWIPGRHQTNKDRPNVSTDLVKRERQALQEAIRDLAKQITDQSKVARKWNEAGLRTTKGLEWTAKSVRKTLSRPGLAGLVEHDGQIVSRIPEDGIVSESDYQLLQAVYDGRRRGATPGRVHLGSGILRCAICGKGLTGKPKGNTYKDGTPRIQYSCNRERRGCGAVYIDGRAVDAQLRLLTVARLSDIEHAAAISTALAEVSERMTEIDREIANIKSVRKALSERVGRREMTPEDFDVSNSFLTADLTPLEAEYERLSSARVEGPGEAIAAEEITRRWDSGNLSEQRALLVKACGLDELRVWPDPQTGTRSFTVDRIKLTDPKTPYGAATKQV
ncbi:recombinase family protein [Umezawaea sp. Da 62-37]|uniref:recombinase family protein n=1 Tax=Umezawaea sp. Da 62-37 TaxID=3075927 RepID=UPI0028F70B76|nr:recombinase family protein [Umezawaea sp. Da 62-37]WNV83847.1 recombinase family protein [Umezawaea sp. Da 62-37]